MAEINDSCWALETRLPSGDSSRHEALRIADIVAFRILPEHMGIRIDVFPPSFPGGWGAEMVLTIHGEGAAALCSATGQRSLSAALDGLVEAWASEDHDFSLASDPGKIWALPAASSAAELELKLAAHSA